MGSRARGAERIDSDWDLLVVADAGVLSALRRDHEFRARANELSADLLVVHDHDNFVEPWGSPEHEKHGSLSGWEWRALSDCEAEYRGTKPRADGWVHVQQCNALRVWPA